MASRPRPIRLTLVGLFIVPMLSLLALWGYAASVTLGNTRTPDQARTLMTSLRPGWHLAAHPRLPEQEPATR